MEETVDLPYGSRFPGVSHKCGHDGHSAAFCGFALEIDQKGSDNNVYFLFQYAEETGDGAIQCSALNEEHNIDEIFGWHNISGLEHKVVHDIDGTAQYASKGMTIQMEGIPSHASEPEKGLPMAKLTEALRPSEDFGHYTKLTKGSYCYIGNGENHPHLHSY